MKHDTIVPIDGLDFSDASRGKFKGLVCLTYRMTTDEDPGTQDPLGADAGDWVLADSLGLESYLGTGTEVTESGGYFSFASTGYWLISFEARAEIVGGENCTDWIKTTNNGRVTWYNSAIAGFGGTGFTATRLFGRLVCSALIKVIDILQDEVKIRQEAGANSYTAGTSLYGLTQLSFTKLADL